MLTSRATARANLAIRSGISGRRLSAAAASASVSVSLMQAMTVPKFGDADVMQMETVPLPIARKGQCIVKVRASGVNPVDTYIRSGRYATLPALPFIPGRDGAGEVYSIDGDTTVGATSSCPSSPSSVAVGDRVYFGSTTSGSAAQYAACDLNSVFKLPPQLGFAAGACLGTPGFTAYRALFQRARATSADTVLVHGASGGVGLMAVQMARAQGMYVVGTAGSTLGMQAVIAAGADACFNHTATNYVPELKALRPEGFSVCLEMLASTNLGIDIGSLLGMGGRVAIVGSRGTVTIDPRDIMKRELEVIGVMLPHSTPEELAAYAAFMNEKIAADALVPTIAMELPLSEAVHAHTEVIERVSGRPGNIVLIPPHDEDM